MACGAICNLLDWYYTFKLQGSNSDLAPRSPVEKQGSVIRKYVCRLSALVCVCEVDLG